MVLVVDLCGESLCMEKATVVVRALYEFLGDRFPAPKLCPDHEAEFRAAAASANLIEGEHFVVVQLCS